ncbi:Alg9-like mannosyltransferase family-domain-containing protein [Schizophyllum amplum]|uniref:Mannosyltransferase n=1 Tax=Schizophyllum amplum TaxID=97359 RepID=A0A550CDN4_9AGAR|nr:Alg9-like mannosyltransferase family-domain-containing protein [Auriculariopsis ampla]
MRVENKMQKARKTPGRRGAQGVTAFFPRFPRTRAAIMASFFEPAVALDVLLFATSYAHVLLAPYTKVEESFNVHAIHDVCLHGADFSQHDHLVHPGPVPRTFLAAAGLGLVLRPITRALANSGFLMRKSDIQIVARLVLATLACAPLAYLRRAVQREFGRLTAMLFVLLCATQFHMMFWMSRTVPNTYAFVLATTATALLLGRSSSKSARRAIALLTAGGVIFRAELALLLAPFTLCALLSGRVSLRQTISTGFHAACASLALTTAVDTAFWQPVFNGKSDPFVWWSQLAPIQIVTRWLGVTPVWPELASMYYNVILGRSADWGVEPPTYYLISLLRCLLTALPLALFALLLDRRVRALLFPSIIFVGLMSLLAHKEWRFVIYVFPAFNVAAARSLRAMVSRPKNSWLGQMMFLAAVAALTFNALVTAIALIPPAVHNYPGGVALSRLHELVDKDVAVHVHISNYAAQTGATLFQHERAAPYPDWMDAEALPKTDWIYDKAEGLTLAALAKDRAITHAIAEEPPVGSKWEVLDVVEGYAGLELWEVLKRGELSADTICAPWTVRTEPQLWVLQRR